MTDARKLAMARALIEDPKHWARGLHKRWTLRGYAFCALGACLEVGVGTCYLYRALAPHGPARSVAAFNDERSHAEVLALFDRAIELAS